MNNTKLLAEPSGCRVKVTIREGDCDRVAIVPLHEARSLENELASAIAEAEGPA